MSLWKIAWKSIEHRALASSLTAFSMSLGVALVVTVLVINGVISKTFQQGAQGYDLIVGAKGSRLQLVLSTVFYNQDPLAPIPYRYYELMKTKQYSAEIAAAIPIARGDNYQGFPVVGTNTDYFRWLQKPNGTPYTFNAGGIFKNAQTNGAVVGYTVAKKMGLKLGDKIRFGHTNRDDDLHAPFEVVGILDHTSSPNDRAVFVNLEGFYEQHSEQTGTFAVDYSLIEAEKAAKRASQGTTEKEAASPKNDKAASAKPDSAPKADAAHDDHDHDHDHDHATDQKTQTQHTDQAAHDAHAGHDHEHSKENRRLTAILLITKEKSVDVAATMEQVDAITSSQPGVEVAEKELVQTK
ncbi:MAG: ABC transporter permease, partial [Thermoguttaceae bacterium]|nr:ABC transporter permease [Thermoguttaceae bacterium]